MRSVIFLILMIIIFGTVDTSWQLVNLYRMHQEILNAKTALVNDKKPVYSSQTVSREKMIDRLTRWIGMSGLSLSALTVTENGEESRSLDINAELSGQFQQIMMFFSELSGQCFPFLIQDAVLSKEKDNLKLKLDATVSTVCVHSGLRRLRLDTIQPRVAGVLRYSDHITVVTQEPSGRVHEKSMFIKKE